MINMQGITVFMRSKFMYSLLTMNSFTVHVFTSKLEVLTMNMVREAQPT